MPDGMNSPHDVLRGVRAPEAVRVRILGGFRVSVGDRIVEENRWGLKKAASLVKLLALEPGHRMHRERVMDLLWPDLGAEAATNNLHRTLYSARHTLEPQVSATNSCYLHLGDEQLELCPRESLWVGVEAFEEAAATARRARDPAAYQAAVVLYAGDLLPEDRYEAWAEERREGVRLTYLSLLLEMAGVHEEREEYEPAAKALRKAITEEPAHEGARAGLVRLYALSGRRGEALEYYERLREDLRRGFSREPDARIRRLHEEILGNWFPPAQLPGEHPTRDADGDHRHNLPVTRSSFVGRERESVEVKRALAMTRLLTLTGAGGSGKTRLAMEVTKDLVGAYPDGAWLVELGGLSDPALVPGEVAEALEIREQPGRSLTVTLAESLRTKDLLLVLDNCEHVIHACAFLADALLDFCPRLRILATSREALGVAGGVNWRVPSLSVPAPRHSVEELSSYESARLFLERAWQQNPAFTLTPENAPTRRQEDSVFELPERRLRNLRDESLRQEAEKPHQQLRSRLRTRLAAAGELIAAEVAGGDRKVSPNVPGIRQKEDREHDRDKDGTARWRTRFMGSTRVMKEQRRPGSER